MNEVHIAQVDKRYRRYSLVSLAIAVFIFTVLIILSISYTFTKKPNNHCLTSACIKACKYFLSWKILTKTEFLMWSFPDCFGYGKQIEFWKTWTQQRILVIYMFFNACHNVMFLEVFNLVKLIFQKGEDFHQFSCGSFIKKERIPEDQSKYDVFDILKNKLATYVAGIYFF